MVSKVIALAGIFVAACSVQTNPFDASLAPQKQGKVSESQEEGYMRIIGDLRWDQMIALDQWMARFPGCVQKTGDSYAYPAAGDGKMCSSSTYGGVSLSLKEVYMEENSMTKPRYIPSRVEFYVYDNSQFRAFEEAIVRKYAGVTDGRGDTLHCSRYTCWRFIDGFQPYYAPSARYGIAIATITPLSRSLIADLEIDSSKF